MIFPPITLGYCRPLKDIADHQNIFPTVCGKKFTQAMLNKLSESEPTCAYERYALKKHVINDKKNDNFMSLKSRIEKNNYVSRHFNIYKSIEKPENLAIE